MSVETVKPRWNGNLQSRRLAFALTMESESGSLTRLQEIGLVFETLKLTMPFLNSVTNILNVIFTILGKFNFLRNYQCPGYGDKLYPAKKNTDREVLRRLEPSLN